MAAIAPTDVNARSAAVSAVMLSIANMFSKLAFGLIGIWLTRYLGPENAGVFFTACAFLGLFAALPDFGVSPLIVRESARQPEKTPVFYGAGLWFFVGSGLTTYALMVGSAGVIGYDRVTLVVIAVLSLMTIGKAGELVASTILQLRQELHIAAIVQFVTACATIFLIYRAVKADADLVGVSWILSGASACSASVLLTVGVLKCRPRFRWDVLKSMVRETYWFAVSGFLANFYLWGGAIILSRLVSEESVGQYSSAFRLISMLYVIPFILFNQIFTPMMFAWAKSDPARLQRTYAGLSRHMAMLGTGFAVGLCVLAGPIVRLIYGEEFLPGAAALQVLAWALPLRYIGSSSGTIMTTADRLRLKSVFQIVLVGLTLALSFTLIPLWGYMGAAVTALSTEAALALFFWYGASKSDYPLHPLRDLSLGRIATAAGTMGALVHFLNALLPVPVTVVCGALWYVGILYAMRFFDENDKRMLREILSARKKTA